MRFRPRLPAVLIPILFCLLLGGAVEACAAGWSFRSGEDLPGDPVAFDFERKTLTIRNPVTEKETIVPTRNLSLRSRQRLLFSPLFHRGVPGESLWPPEKRRLLLYGMAVPATLLFFGFWAAGGFFTGRFNPLLAFVGWLGSWIVIGIFAICYAFLALRLQGGTKLTLTGFAVSLATTPLYISAVYNCTYLKGFSVLLSHLLAGGCLLAIGLAAFEVGMGERGLEAWWNDRVFAPVGLISAEPAPPQRGP